MTIQKWILAAAFALLLYGSCHANAQQSQFIYGSQLKLASAGVSGPAVYMPGLAEYWEYNKGGTGIGTVGPPTNNTVVTNWFGQIQGTLLTNGAGSTTSLLPTNSSSGLGWNGSLNMMFTNLQFAMGTNWTIVLFEEMTAKSVGGSQAVLISTNNLASPGSGFQLFFTYSGSFQTVGYTTPSGAHPLVNDFSIPVPQTSFWDISISASNNPTGKVFVYTNGFCNTAQISQGDANPEFAQILFNDNDGIVQRGPRGFLQGYYILTNALTPTIASNIHYYRTNISLFPQ